MPCGLDNIFNWLNIAINYNSLIRHKMDSDEYKCIILCFMFKEKRQIRVDSSVFIKFLCLEQFKRFCIPVYV